MKTNFKPGNTEDKKFDNSKKIDTHKDLTKDEFEEFVSKAGAKGSFMIFRSKNKKDEMGIDQL